MTKIKTLTVRAGKLILNSVKAIFKGEFLLRLRIGDYFLHIAWCFCIAALTIWMSLLIDNTLTKVEKGKAVISRLENDIAEREFTLASMMNRRQIRISLEEAGSRMEEPRHRAVELEYKMPKSSVTGTNGKREGK